MMTEPESTNQGEQQGTEQTANTNPQNTGTGTGTNAGNTEEKMVPQSRVDEIVKERLERQKRAIDAEATKKAEEAAAQKLKEQAQWQKLAEDNEAKVKDLAPQVETLTSERDQLREIVAAAITEETKDWPKEVKDLLPAADADVVTRHAAVVRTRGLAQRLAGQGNTPGNGPNPRPAGGAGASPDHIIEQKRASGVYQPL